MEGFTINWGIDDFDTQLNARNQIIDINLILNFQDLGLASSVATNSNSPIPLGALSHQIYRTLMAKGLGGKDFSVVYDFIKNEGK